MIFGAAGAAFPAARSAPGDGEAVAAGRSRRVAQPVTVAGVSEPRHGGRPDRCPAGAAAQAATTKDA